MSVLGEPSKLVGGVLSRKLAARGLRLATVYWFLVAFHLGAWLWSVLLVVAAQDLVVALAGRRARLQCLASASECRRRRLSISRSAARPSRCSSRERSSAKRSGGLGGAPLGLGAEIDRSRACHATRPSVMGIGMRIAIVSDYYYPQLGGITEHVHGQATELTRRGHEVTIVTPRLFHIPKTVDADDLPARTFELHRVGCAVPFYANGAETLVSLGPRLPRTLTRLFSERRFDVIHVHNPFGVMLPMTAIVRSSAPVTVATLHSVVPENYRPLRAAAPVLDRVLRRLDERICVSGAVIDSIQPYFRNSSFRSIPNGIDAEFFSPEASPLPELGGKRNIIFVGRFDPRNGVKHMLGAFAALRRFRDDVRLIVVGDGPLRPLVERMVPAGLRSEVRFAGRVNRLRPRYLASAAILCTPCSLASFGMVLLEGMSAGLPVVASRLPGFELVMRDGIDGLVVDRADDDQGFADALNRLLDDPARAGSMGEAGRQRALSAFAWPVVVDRLESLYAELLARDGGQVRSLATAD